MIKWELVTELPSTFGFLLLSIVTSDLGLATAVYKYSNMYAMHCEGDSMLCLAATWILDRTVHMVN